MFRLHPPIWTTCTTFFERQCVKNLGRGLPLPPHPQIDPIYTVSEKWTKSKRTATFFSEDLPLAVRWLLLTIAPWYRSRALTLVKTVRRAFRDRDPLTHRGEKSGHWCWTREGFPHSPLQRLPSLSLSIQQIKIEI